MNDLIMEERYEDIPNVQTKTKKNFKKWIKNCGNKIWRTCMFKENFGKLIIIFLTKW